MGFGSLLVLALGLSMDAAAVSAACGLQVRAIAPRRVALVALTFGGFHVAAPVAGYLLGEAFSALVAAWSPWIAAALLTGLGLKMLHEAFVTDERVEAAERGTRDPFAPRVLLTLAVGTSLDAVAAGVTLSMLEASISLAAVTIGVTAGTLSALGLVVGHRVGAVLGRRLDALGGFALLGLGLQVLLAHLLG